MSWRMTLDALGGPIGLAIILAGLLSVTLPLAYHAGRRSWENALPKLWRRQLAQRDSQLRRQRLLIEGLETQKVDWLATRRSMIGQAENAEQRIAEVTNRLVETAQQELRRVRQLADQPTERERAERRKTG